MILLSGCMSGNTGRAGGVTAKSAGTRVGKMCGGNVGLPGLSTSRSTGRMSLRRRCVLLLHTHVNISELEKIQIIQSCFDFPLQELNCLQHINVWKQEFSWVNFLRVTAIGKLSKNLKPDWWPWDLGLGQPFCRRENSLRIVHRPPVQWHQMIRWTQIWGMGSGQWTVGTVNLFASWNSLSIVHRIIFAEARAAAKGWI